MKKIYAILAIAFFGSLAYGQSFFVPTSYRGALAPAPTAQWTDNWVNWDPQNTIYGTSTVNVTTSITTSTTWTSNNVYLLQGQIYVKNGAILTIQPGTVIMGDKTFVGSGLFICQGSKLIANGTVNSPIVFTSNQPAGSRAAGDWGGLILMGKATTNVAGGIGNIEGLTVSPDTQFGGGANPDNNDNSGSLKYVRIEFPGYVYQPNKEINGLTMGAVGKATTIDYVQVSFSNDDAFEWFGGSVNCRHLVSYRNLDDDFDTDNGFSGNIQFCIGVRDPNIADNPSVSTSEGFESDNDATGSNLVPQTTAVFSNVTWVGPLRGNVAAVVASGYRRSARLRRNSALKIYNSIFMDGTRGVHIDGTACEANATNGTSLATITNNSATPTFGVLKFKNNLVAGYQPTRSVEVNVGSTFNISNWFGLNANDSVASSANILVNPYGTNFLNPDLRPIVGSNALSNISYVDLGINPMLIGAPISTATVNYCIGATASALTATANNDCTLLWYMSAVGGSSIPTPTPNTLVAGTTVYYVSQINVDGYEGARTMVTVSINALPTINAGTNQTVCSGTPVTLNASGASTYAWNNGVSNGVSFIPTATTTYQVTGTAVNGCTNTASVTVTVNASPTINAGANQTVCAGTSVTLNASGASTYAWNNGVSNGVSFIPTATTTYQVTGTAVNGCTNTDLVTVTVNALPTINAGVNQTVCAGTPVTLNASGATNYSWNNGVSNGVSFIPTATTTYQVTGTAVNGCTNTDLVTVTVNALPTINAGVNQTVCAGTSVTLNASGASTYAWNNGVINGVSFIPTATTTYTVTGTAVNGCTNTALVTVNLNALPATPVITASGSTSFCTGSSINLTSSYNNGNVWSTGAISSTINVANTSVVTVTYTNANGCSATSAPTSINVSAAPQPTVQVSSNQACTGDTVILTASPSNSYLWSNGQTTQSILITATTPSITVTVTNAIACNGAGTSQPVTVTFVTALPTVTASSLTACTGNTVTLTSSPADSYTWSTGQTTQSISISATTTASVTTTNSNACNGYGMSQATTVTFTTVLPTATASSLTACSGDTVTLTSSPADSYTWSTGQTTQSISITATTTASVTTTNTNACNGYGMSPATTVTFTATPTAAGAFTTNGNVVSFTNTSTGAASYSWDFGDQSNSSAIAPSHAYIGNGVYVVTLTAINGACTDVITFDVTLSVGLDELTGLSNVNIYPNPANDVLNIDYNKNGDDVVEISIIDQFGRIITSINGLSNGFNHNTIDVSNLQSAVYYVRFTTNGFSKTERLVIR